MIIKVSESIKLVVLISVFFLQFLGLIIFVNSLGSLSKEINNLQSEKSSTSQQIRDYYNKKVKDIKKDVDFFGEKYDYERVNSGDYVNYKDIKLKESEMDENIEGVTNSNRVFLSD